MGLTGLLSYRMARCLGHFASKQGLLSDPPRLPLNLTLVGWLGARGAKDAEITSRLAKHATSTFQTKWKPNSYFVFQHIQVLRGAFVLFRECKRRTYETFRRGMEVSGVE